MRRLVGLPKSLLLLIVGLVLFASPAAALASASPPQTASVYGMDILGLGWQWSYPRIDAWPRMSGSIRLDILDAMLRDAAEAGVRWNRLTVWWCMVEPERGQWFWDDVDAVIQIGRNYGIETVPVLLYTPYWAVAGAPVAPECVNNMRKNYPPTDLADWEDFVRTIVRRYGPMGKGVVRYWEIWNEPDLPEFLSIVNDPGDGTVPVYAELLNRAARIIRADAPGSQILIGGLSDIKGSKFLDKLLALTGALDVRQSFDVVSFHAYSSHAYKTSLIRDVLVKYGLGSRPLWNTELNYLGWSYDQAATGLAGLYQLMAANGVSRSFWYLSFTSHWGPGIFYPHEPYWQPTPFVRSPFHATLKGQAAPSRLPAAPVIVGPDTASKDPQPRFEWQVSAPGVYPVAGYKLLIDDELFLGEPYWARPDFDVWVPSDQPTYLPLVTGGGRLSEGAFGGEALPYAPRPVAGATAVRGYSPGAALAWGAHYWQVAAVDTQGNVGPYSQPRLLYVQAPHAAYVPLVAR